MWHDELSTLGLVHLLWGDVSHGYMLDDWALSGRPRWCRALLLQLETKHRKNFITQKTMKISDSSV